MRKVLEQLERKIETEGATDANHACMQGPTRQITKTKALTRRRTFLFKRPLNEPKHRQKKPEHKSEREGVAAQ